MSTRFKWLAIISYGGILLSVVAVVLLFLGFGRVGDCSTQDNTWDACNERTDFLATLTFCPLLMAVLASTATLFVRRRPGEKGKWVAGSAFLVAPLMLACLIWFFLHLGIR